MYYHEQIPKDFLYSRYKNLLYKWSIQTPAKPDLSALHRFHCPTKGVSFHLDCEQSLVIQFCCFCHYIQYLITITKVNGSWIQSYLIFICTNVISKLFFLISGHYRLYTFINICFYFDIVLSLWNCNSFNYFTSYPVPYNFRCSIL